MQTNLTGYDRRETIVFHFSATLPCHFQAGERILGIIYINRNIYGKYCYLDVCIRSNGDWSIFSICIYFAIAVDPLIRVSSLCKIFRKKYSLHFKINIRYHKYKV